MKELSEDPIIRDLEIMSEAKNYHDWIFSHFRPHLGRRVLELGAGIGNMTEMMRDRELVIAVDIHEAAVQYLRNRFAAADNIIPMLMDIEGESLMGLKDHHPDTIVCINVLEHIEDDRQALQSMHALLEPGGKVLLLVPAFQFLYGGVDKAVGHYRRYGRRELFRKLDEAGYRVRDIFYMNSVAVPGWYLHNRIRGKSEESPSQVLMFDRFVAPWLRPLEALVRPPFGLSLIAVAEVPQTE